MTPTETARPLRADAQRNLDQIRRAARSALAEHGLDVSMDEIARRAGVGMGTIYRRYPDKTALVHDICLDALTRYTHLARSARTEESDPWAAFTHFMHEAIAWGTTAVLPTLAGQIPLTAELRAAGSEYEHALGELIAAVQHAEQLRPDIEASEIPLLLISVTRQPTTGDAASTHARHLAVLLDGLRARPDNTPLSGHAPNSEDIHRLYLDQ